MQAVDLGGDPRKHQEMGSEKEKGRNPIRESHPASDHCRYLGLVLSGTLGESAEPSPLGIRLGEGAWEITHSPP